MLISSANLQVFFINSPMKVLIFYFYRIILQFKILLKFYLYEILRLKYSVA